MGFRRLCVRKEWHTIERFSLVDSVLKKSLPFLLKSISNKVFAEKKIYITGLQLLYAANCTQKDIK